MAGLARPGARPGRPEGAGKSHLAAIWAEIAGARRVSAAPLGGTNLLAELATAALVVEDAGEAFDERALFHLINLVRQEEAYLLITARAAPATWGAALAESVLAPARHSGCGADPPDDALLRAVMVKLFADRQLAVDESLIGYLAARIERSFAGARAAVDDLDREALRQQRPVTRALAAELMARGVNSNRITITRAAMA